MRRALAPIFVLALLAGLAGCGSGDDAGDDTTTTEATGTTEASAEEAGDTSTTEGEGSDDDTDDETDTTTAPGTYSEAEYEAALQVGLSSGVVEEGGLVLDDDEAQCVAEGWVAIVTVPGLEASGVTLEELEDPNYRYVELGLDVDQAQEMIDAFEPCDADLTAKLVESITLGLDEEQIRCAVEAVDRELANDLLLTAFTEENGDGSVEFEVLLDQLAEACDLPA